MHARATKGWRGRLVNAIRERGEGSRVWATRTWRVRVHGAIRERMWATKARRARVDDVTREHKEWVARECNQGAGGVHRSARTAG